jgi:hypothetical protein
METSEPLQEQSLSELTSLPGDSPAKISALPAVALESTASDPAYGENMHGLLGTFDPGTYLLKTSQVCLLTNQCDEYSGTFPRSGTMRNGKVFQQLPLVRPTYESESGYLPTPEKSVGAFVAGLNANITVFYAKETTGTRKSGAKIGSSLIWCPEYIREALRTGGLVNPVWLEALMGFPENWSIPETEHSETP